MTQFIWLQEEVQGSEPPGETSVPSKGKVPQLQEAQQGVLQENTRVILDDPSESDSSSRSEDENYPDEGEKNSITYNSESGKSDEISNSATDT